MNTLKTVDVCRKCRREGIEPESQRHLVSAGKNICCRCGTQWNIGSEIVLPTDVAPILSELLLNYMFELVDVRIEHTPDSDGVLPTRNELILRNKSQGDLKCVLSWRKLDLIHAPERLPRWNADQLELEAGVPPLVEAVVRKVAHHLPENASDEATRTFGRRSMSFRNIWRRNHGYADLLVVVSAELSWND